MCRLRMGVQGCLHERLSHLLKRQTGMRLKGRDLREFQQQLLGKRLEGVTKAVGSGYCWLQMLLKRALAVRKRAARPQAWAPPGGGA